MRKYLFSIVCFVAAGLIMAYLLFAPLWMDEETFVHVSCVIGAFTTSLFLSVLGVANMPRKEANQTEGINEGGIAMKKKTKIIVLDLEKDGPEEVLEFDRSELIAEYLEYADLKESDVEAVCFTVKPNDYGIYAPAELPKEALKALSEADVVLFPDGWDRSDCGRLAYGACKLFGLYTYEQDYSSQLGEEEPE